MCHRLERSEENFRFGKAPAFPLEQLGHRFIMENANARGKNLCGQVEIADFPCHQRPICHRLERHFIDLLDELPDDVVTAVLMKNHPSVREPFFQIESELHTIRRHPAPAPLQELPPLCRKLDLMAQREPGNWGGHCVNQLHFKRGWQIEFAASIEQMACPIDCERVP